MTTPLSELYQRLVIDHNRSPHNQRPVPGCTAQARGHSPLCGDDLHVQIRLEDHRISDLGFDGDACAVATASASLLTDACRGLSTDKALALVQAMILLVEQGDAVAREQAAEVDPELALLGAAVHAFPGRHKCAKLPWMTLASLLPTEHGSGQHGKRAVPSDPDLRISVGAGPGVAGSDPAVTEAG